MDAILELEKKTEIRKHKETSLIANQKKKTNTIILLLFGKKDIVVRDVVLMEIHRNTTNAVSIHES